MASNYPYSGFPSSTGMPGAPGVSQLVQSAQGAVLDQHNKQLVARLHELKSARSATVKEIADKEAEKAQLEQALSDAMKRINELKGSISKKVELTQDYDHVITDAESMYQKIIDSSNTLITALDQQVSSLHTKPKASTNASWQDESIE